jgi:hypothetical protein
MTMILKTLAGVALATLLTAGSSGATVLYSETFDSENAGVAADDFGTFSQFSVDGHVDLVDFAAPGPGLSVDLGSAAGRGTLISKIFAFSAGDVLTLTFDASSDQRGGGDTGLVAGFRFDEKRSFDNYAGGGAFGSFNLGPFFQGSIVSVATDFDGQPFKSYSLSFRALEGGSVQTLIGTTDDDDFGPLIDNVRFELAEGPITAIPEPASWALMITGFSGAGAVLRRKRAAKPAA